MNLAPPFRQIIKIIFFGFFPDFSTWNFALYIGGNIMSADANEESIFKTAIQLQSPAERTAYLERVCGTDDALRTRLEALLEAHEQEYDFLRPLVVHRDVAEWFGLSTGVSLTCHVAVKVLGY